MHCPHRYLIHGRQFSVLLHTRGDYSGPLRHREHWNPGNYEIAFRLRRNQRKAFVINRDGRLGIHLSNFWYQIKRGKSPFKRPTF